MNSENLYKSACNLAERLGWISVASFQRHYALGFSIARAAVLRLETEGIVSEPDKQGTRVLVDN